MEMARRAYFDRIRELVAVFLDRGLDLANFPANLGGLVRYMGDLYFGNPEIVSEEEREESYQWPRILFNQALQAILEDEDRSIGEALAAGWLLYLDTNGYPDGFDADVRRYRAVWDTFDVNGQEEFLTSFSVDAATLRDWASRLRTTDLASIMYLNTETDAPDGAFTAAFPGEELDICHAKVQNPDEQAAQCCPICRESLEASEIGILAEHRPVQTPCG
jgi:hypothetical protein